MLHAGRGGQLRYVSYGATSISKHFKAFQSVSCRGEVQQDVNEVRGLRAQKGEAMDDPEKQHLSEQIALSRPRGQMEDRKTREVFAFARIPPLVQLGAKLDDTWSVRTFQRPRADHQHAWR